MSHLPADGLTWAALALAAALVGFAKTGINGTASLAIVLFAAVLPARASTGALLPILIAGDVFATRFYRHHVDWRMLARLAPWVVAGTALGGVLLGVSDDTTMRVIIGVILLVMLAGQLLLTRLRPAAEPTGSPSRTGAVRRSAAAGAGIAAGAATMLANAAGPVMVLYLILSGLSKLRFLGTMAWFFLAVNLLKAPISAGLGLITWPTLAVTLVLLPAVALGAWAGLLLVHRIKQKQFESATLVLSAVGAALLII